MRYFKEKKTGEVFAYQEGEQDDLIAECEGNKKAWQDVTGSWPPPLSQEQLDELAVAQAKMAKESALESIIVTTTSGKVFDGNERARINMLSAITTSGILGQTSSAWKLADNTVEIITLDELKEALALSIKRVGEIVTAA